MLIRGNHGISGMKTFDCMGHILSVCMVLANPTSVYAVCVCVCVCARAHLLMQMHQCLLGYIDNSDAQCKPGLFNRIKHPSPGRMPVIQTQLLTKLPIN